MSLRRATAPATASNGAGWGARPAAIVGRSWETLTGAQNESTHPPSRQAAGRRQSAHLHPGHGRPARTGTGNRLDAPRRPAPSLQSLGHPRPLFNQLKTRLKAPKGLFLRLPLPRPIFDLPGLHQLRIDDVLSDQPGLRRLQCPGNTDTSMDYFMLLSFCPSHLCLSPPY